MKLWAISMVRNEADIIEAFVRHNLAFVDGLAILDHDSTDGTFEILSRLAAEGLPLARLRTTDAAFFQGSQVSALARECFQRTGADFAFALDADEFIRARSRAAVEKALGELPADFYAVQEWRTYVPTSFQSAFGPDSLRFRLRAEATSRHKVVIPKSFLHRSHEMVSEGNHWIADTRSETSVQYRQLPPEITTLAHCPVRSARQLESKIRLGYQALLAGGAMRATLASHWREIHEDLARGIALTDERLRLIALNYGIPRANWAAEDEIEVVDDPVELRCVGK